MIPPLAGKKRNPCSHRSDRARAQGRVATPFPCVVGVAHCVTELAHEDPYTDAATTISARRGIIQLVLRLVICATRCHRRAVRATGVRTQDVARWVHASVSLRVQVGPHMGHSTMQLRAWHCIGTVASDPTKMHNPCPYAISRVIGETLLSARLNSCRLHRAYTTMGHKTVSTATRIPATRNHKCATRIPRSRARQMRATRALGSLKTVSRDRHCRNALLDAAFS